jgi:virginiamycin B lyase
VTVYALPDERSNANLNTATFDTNGMLWFTGQSGVYGKLDPKTGVISVWDAPKGSGPYGMASAPDGSVWFASLAGNYIAHIDTQSGAATVVEPPTPNQSARRVWVDSKNKVWVSDFGNNAIVNFSARRNEWKSYVLPSASANVRQLLGRNVGFYNEIWGAESGTN